MEMYPRAQFHGGLSVLHTVSYTCGVYICTLFVCALIRCVLTSGFHNLICLLPSLSTATVPCVSTQSSPSSTAPQPHPPTLPGELCSLYTPSRLGVYMYTTVTCVVVCVICLSFPLSLTPSPHSTALIASSTSLPCTSSSVSPVSVSTTAAGELCLCVCACVRACVRACVCVRVCVRACVCTYF